MTSFDMEDYTDKLKNVFQLCDSEKKGYISVAHFIDLAKEHFGAGGGNSSQEDIQGIVKVLDPEGDGKIHFNEFCQGVRHIMELSSPSTPPVNIFPGGPRLMHIGSDETLVPQEEDATSSGTHETSEMSTFNEYDMMTDDDQQPPSTPSDFRHCLVDLGQRPLQASEDDRDSAFSGKSSEGREHRPDGEVTDEEYCLEEDSHESDEGDGMHSPGHSSRQSPHLHNSANRRVTPSALASQLYKHSVEGSLGSDDIIENIDGSFVELNDKVRRLESQVNNLSDTQVKNDQRHIRMKEENTSLVERIHILEEQLRDVETKAQQRLAEEEKKHRETLSRAEKEKSREIEILGNSLQHIEREYLSLKDEAPRLRQENERLRKELLTVSYTLDETQQQLASARDERRDLLERMQADRMEAEQERRIHSQLLDELSRELEDLRIYKVEVEAGNVPSRCNGVEVSRSQRKQLEGQIVRLKEENIRLCESAEELQAQLLSNQIHEGRSLIQKGDASLAEEMENLPRDELLKNVKEMQEDNATLRHYIERLTLRILEKNPSLLEIPIQRRVSSK